ncbi:MAG: outer membrane protein assembly factor BamA [Rhabdochlamydiaceae bacterium]|nr:outer membrane protein assembly factor BamA [Rhabdochlamydiaceae bacterium]
MSKKYLIALSLIAFTCVPLPTLRASYSSIEAFEDRKVANIDISVENLPANATFDAKTVLGRLKTKIGDPFSQLTFDSDLKALSEEYDRVEPSINVHNGEVYVHLKLWPRPNIRTMTWSGNKHIKTKTLQKELGIKSNAVFNRQAFNKAFNKVKEYYVKKGYFESQLHYSVIPDPKTNEVDIRIEVFEGRSGKIDNIVFEGFSKDEQSEILSMIHTKKYNLFTSWLTGQGTYSEEALEQDKLTIINLLQNKGYADAKVDIKVLEAKSEGKILLEIHAERGPIYHLKNVKFKGNTLFTDAEIDSRFLVRPEGVYSPENLRQTAQNIKDLYGRKGFIDCNVQYETQLVSNEPLYNVTFIIDEGQEYKIGLVRIFGNVQTKNNVILRESLLVPGETFDTAKLKATQTRLENVGYFKTVNVYAVRTQDDQALGENYRDVYIEVDETTTGNISLFFGFSTADDLFGGLDLSESNFNYKGFGKIFSEGLSALRGGGEYAHARVSIGSKQTSYTLSWLTPYFRDTLWRVGFDVTQSTSTLISNDYDIKTIGSTFYASYPLNYYWTFGTKYRIRNADVHVSHSAPKKERQQADSDGLISAVSSSISFDSTDSAIKPHNGFRSTLEGEFAGIGGDFTFTRLSYVNTYYTQLWRRGIMKYRFEFRFIQPFWKSSDPNDIPLSERFFLGGENSVRGYKAFSLGPEYSNGDPKGGISSSLLSIEYLQEIVPFLDAFLFIDAGSVAMKRWYLANFKMTYGFGARIELINRVPIIVGMGFPVNPDHENQVRRFFFSMGGQF